MARSQVPTPPRTHSGTRLREKERKGGREGGREAQPRERTSEGVRASGRRTNGASVRESALLLPRSLSLSLSLSLEYHDTLLTRLINQSISQSVDRDIDSNRIQSIDWAISISLSHYRSFMVLACRSTTRYLIVAVNGDRELLQLLER